MNTNQLGDKDNLIEIYTICNYLSKYSLAYFGIAVLLNLIDFIQIEYGTIVAIMFILNTPFLLISATKLNFEYYSYLSICTQRVKLYVDNNKHYTIGNLLLLLILLSPLIHLLTGGFGEATILLLIYYSTLLVIGSLFYHKNKGIKQSHGTARTYLNSNSNYYTLIALVILVGLVLRLYSIDNHNFMGDEYQVITTAYGYLQTGEFLRWDFIANEPADYYTRAWPHTILISLSFLLFGFSEFAARLPSAIFGTLLLLVYFILLNKFLKSRLLVLSFVVFLSLNHRMISLSQEARMYIIFLTTTLCLLYLIYSSITSERNSIYQNYIPNKYASYIPFNINYGVILAPVLLFSYYIQRLTLTLGIGVLIYVLYLFVTDEQKRHLATPLLLSIAGAVIIAIEITTGSDIVGLHFITIRENPHYEYIGYLTEFTFPTYLAFPIIVSSIYIIRENEFVKYLLFVSLVGVIFFVWFSNRYSTFNYIAHLAITFSLVIPILLDKLVVYHKDTNWMKVSISMLIIFSSVTMFIVAPPYVESGNDYEVSYEAINEGYEEGDVLMGQYPRRPYFDIDQEVNYVSMKNNRQFSYEEYNNVVEQNNRVWVTWEHGKDYHIKSEIREDIDDQFTQLHGNGVDGTGVNVYLLNKTTNGV